MKKLLTRSATLLLALVFSISATGCQQLLNEIPFPRRTAVATQPAASPQATLTHDMQKTELPAVVEDNLNKIILWLPPAFDPENGSSAGRGIQERLQAFRYDHPEVTIEVRVKALNGPGSLLDSLSAATLAAPAVVPGLLILPHTDLAIAVSQGLIVPVEAEQNPANQADHFAFAEELVRVNGLNYGLPFAADVFCLAYKNQQVAYPPVYWQEVIQLGKILAFPAGEAQGLTAQLLYLEKGGTFTQNETQITVDEVPLQQTLMFLAEGANADVFPYWLTNSNRFEDSWQAVLDAQATYAVVRASQYLSALPENIAITSVPSFTEKRLSLADGWVIAFPASSPEHFELYRQLAAYLVEPRFQAEWTESAGLMPVSRTALSLWKNNEVSGILLELAESARVVPPAHIISRVGPLFAQATSEMIRQQTTYIESANKVIKSLAEVPLE